MKPQVTLLALALLAGGVALAETPATQGPGPDGADRMERMALLLDLDSYQKTEVEKILKEHHDKMRSEFEAARASGTKPTREEMEAKREASQQELHTKLSGVLNETQLKKFDALHEGRPGPRFGGGKRDRASKATTDSASN